jgi:hypothetical protein
MLVPDTQARVSDPPPVLVWPMSCGYVARQLTAHYLDGPAATLDDGWLRTGDLVRIDADGWIHLVDRHLPMRLHDDRPPALLLPLVDVEVVRAQPPEEPKGILCARSSSPYQARTSSDAMRNWTPSTSR